MRTFLPTKACCGATMTTGTGGFAAATRRSHPQGRWEPKKGEDPQGGAVAYEFR
jgi:hypothetical protein